RARQDGGARAVPFEPGAAPRRAAHPGARPPLRRPRRGPGRPAPPRAPAHLRDAPARRRRRPPRHPEAPRPRDALDDAALHPRLGRPPAPRVRPRSPAREADQGGGPLRGARGAWSRLARSLFGASLCALAAAMLDAGWARAAGGEAVAY